MRPDSFLSLSALLAFSLALTGCALNSTATGSSESGMALRGNVHGGRQPVAGGHIYLFAAGTSGYGGASTSLLTTGLAGTDSFGGYVLTDASGNFTISGDYVKCTVGTPVYVLGTQGNPGLPNGQINPNLALMTAIGQCPASGSFATTVPYVTVNEVTTVASVYALSGYMTDLSHVASNTSTQSVLGIDNAFATVNSLVNIATGTALATTPSKNGTVPQQEIDTLANILASCTNSAGASSSACTTLFANALNGTTAPTDITTAALNIAHSPGKNIASLFGLQAGSGTPFLPDLATASPDFSIAIAYTGGGMKNPFAIAIDASGNVWLGDENSGVVSEFNGATGAPISATGYATPVPTSTTQVLAIDPGSGNVWVVPHTPEVAFGAGNGVFKITSAGAISGPITGGGLSSTTFAAIDGVGDVWISNFNHSASSITELDYTGAIISPGSGFTGGGLFTPQGIAIDDNYNVWTADFDNLAFTSSGLAEFGYYLGNPESPAAGYSIAGTKNIQGLVIDGSNNIWVPSSTGFVKVNSSGVEQSPSGGYTGSGCCGAQSYGLAVDGAGNIWGGSGAYGTGVGIAEVNSAGTVLSPTANSATGYVGGKLSTPSAVAVDPSGNLWVADLGYTGLGSLTEFVGLAIPVVTPITPGQLGVRPQTFFTTR